MLSAVTMPWMSCLARTTRFARLLHDPRHDDHREDAEDHDDDEDLDQRETERIGARQTGVRQCGAWRALCCRWLRRIIAA